MTRALIAVALIAVSVTVAPAEVILREDFEQAAATDLLRWMYGDKPTELLANGAEPGVGVDGSAGAHFRARFGPTQHHQSYWAYILPEPIPLVEGLQAISFRVRSTSVVRLKVGIAPFGFIYHAPESIGSGEWETITLDSAWDELSVWCQGGERDPRQGFIDRIIFSVVNTDNITADVVIDDLVLTAAEGTGAMIDRERFARQVARTRINVVTQLWSDEGRTLAAVERLIDEAAADGADLCLLPQECVKTVGEPIPGPVSSAVAAKAAQHSMYVVGCIRETEGERTYVTSFLCDREGRIVGKYRKSHKLPDEDMDLGEDLPVFRTDFGTVAMRIGTDRHFVDIDHVYGAKGARMILWSQMPEPVDDEYLQDAPVLGRAIDYALFYACARYANAGEGWITNKFPPYRGMPIGRSWVVNPEGQRIACTRRTGAGVATAAISRTQLQGGARGRANLGAFRALTEPVVLPEPRHWAKRLVRLTAIENHVSFDQLLTLLDEAGEMGSDLVVTYELVWIPLGRDGAVSEEAVAAAEATARDRLAQVAAKARQWGMYVLVAGVIEAQEVNEAILFDRQGQEAGRYRKIVSTYDEQIVGTETPILEADFGRIGVRICADEAYPEIDRCYGIKGADIIAFPTQSWGPGALHRDLRDLARCMDAGAFLVEATHSGTEARHRSLIADPAGAIVAASALQRPGLVSAVVDLDNDRPRRYIRAWTPHEPKGYLPQYQPTELPAVANDLQETIRAQRRPALYGVLAPQPQ
ncbi:MAG: carbon-nitrogen hydrolase family protein [Armatimonadota bacterium]